MKQAPKSRTATRGSSWDDPENEALNTFLVWGEPGDYILGALVSKKQVPSTLPDRQGELQWVYEVKAREGQYHKLDEKKRVIDEPIVIQAGELISVGGRKMYDSRLARVQIGQVFGLKFVEELPAKTRGYSATKLIKVFTPKNDAGEYEVDQEVVDAHNGEELAGEFDNK